MLMPPGSGPTDPPPSHAPAPLGRILIVVLGLNVVLALIALQAALVFVHAVWLAMAGHVLAQAEPGRIGRQLAILRLVQAVAWLGAGALFLAWVHGAHRTLRALGLPRAPSARDAALAFVVPGPNLVRPPRVVATLWRASAAPERPAGATTWVAWWWGVCLATLALDLSLVLPGRWLLTWSGLGGGLPLLALGECARIAAAILTIVLVTRIDRCLRDRWTAGALGRAEVPADA
jgi:hypothetical protein